jgi:hypothetical protein
MHVIRTLLVAALVSPATIAAAQQPVPEPHAMKPAPGFGTLTTLVGEWEGRTPDGTRVVLSFELGSGGTALIERLRPSDEPEMVTVYHPDGDAVAVTHYCSSGNQPQMRTAALSGAVKQFSFELVRVTNLATPATGHMRRLTVTLVDQDHLTQEWTWHEDGKSQSQVFEYTRKS